MTIAYLGTGLLGSGFAYRLIENGHTVRVWNRTAGKTQALEAAGATACADAADAVRGVDRVHLTLADDASVDAVLESLVRSIAPPTVIVDHTTTAPTPTAERSARWRARGITFLHAPVFMGPQQSREGTGIMLASGAQSSYDALLPALQSMTGKVLYLGAEPGRAAAFKLFGNLMIIALTAGLGDVNRLADAIGVSTADAMALFAEFNPGTMLGARAAKIAADDFTPTFEMSMARKDVRLMIEEAARHGVTLGIMPAIADVYDAAIARGEGSLDTSAIARINANPDR